MNPWNPELSHPTREVPELQILTGQWKSIVHLPIVPIWKLNGKRYPAWYKIATHHSKRAVDMFREI